MYNSFNRLLKVIYEKYNCELNYNFAWKFTHNESANKKKWKVDGETWDDEQHIVTRIAPNYYTFWLSNVICILLLCSIPNMWQHWAIQFCLSTNLLLV